ncbi:competence/damage-inducible protein A [Cohnella lubricantis]|uniref:Putative competence-damage inducible protein n=1 Tax=Cohnella lubricantis TaxID=2163172 RepID=A0A841TGY0_9BACL|nr:competence/damage-inducible protein A [Cohnella lubricantis]MBB6679646.1 competence/damage-inducible protein A [Cohnella lubricantis]MBP2119888.1 nicotinamide-nucleotide amidase [Cohnella lubricantis]
MRAEIIAVGTELLLGQIVNTNAQYLSQGLAELGIDVYYQTVVGDNAERIRAAIETARQRADLLVFTGGLGPTLDDLTRDVLADYLGRGIEVHEPTMHKIEQMSALRGTAFIESNRRQAHLIEGATPLRNDTGLAVGNALSEDGTSYLLLPGPPREMKPMFENDGSAWLREALGESTTLHSVMLKFSGIGESALEDLLLDLIREQSDPTLAPYAKEGEVAVRVSTKARDAEEAERKLEPTLREIRSRTQRYLYAEEDIPMEAAVIRLMTQKRLTLTLAESCTGGMIAASLTTVPGSADAFVGGVVSYSNGVKHKLLGVPMALLEGEGAPGAVSEETAAAMAEGALTAAGADLALSVTGVAGPAGVEGKPVGLVYVGLAERGRPTRVERLQLSGDREGIRIRASKRALHMLWLTLTGQA